MEDAVWLAKCSPFAGSPGRVRGGKGRRARLVDAGFALIIADLFIVFPLNQQLESPRVRS